MALKEIKKSKNFWVTIVIGSLLLLLGIVLLPFWLKMWPKCPWGTWGSKLLSYFMVAAIFFYLFAYVFKKIKSSRGTVQVLTIIEFVLLALVGLGLVFNELKVINISDEPAQILGLVLYLRGVIEIFRAYYHQRDSKVKYPVWWLAVMIFFITFGVYLWFNPIISRINLVWILGLIFVVIGLLFVVRGVLAKPNSRRK